METSTKIKNDKDRPELKEKGDKQQKGSQNKK
jgi:hypothetical protein